jgi:serine/threonine-protein kinase RsbW
MQDEDKIHHLEQEIILDSNIAELERLQAFINKFCEVESVPEETCFQLQVVLEELILNAMNYGECNPSEDAIRLSIKRQGNELLFVLSDTGKSFNPLEAPEPDLTGDVLTRQVGGLGIHLVRNLVHSLRYERREGRNYLYFAKRMSPAPNTAPPEGETDANRNGNNQS